ncbi:MAG TPA: zinc-finger domain-containing protein [Candidatus Marinimicrobia bacterium]|nr:zinc-finger domain-containing protein [Candidatus Neomarinimicrobiota bacterium]
MPLRKANAENSYVIPEEERIVRVDEKYVFSSDSTTVHNRKIKCDNDHPVVYYTIEESGFAVCGYCGMKYILKE